MAGRSDVVTLTLNRSLRLVEEYTLTAEKLRLERRGPFSRGIVEVPLSFLAPTWVVRKGSTRARGLFYAAAMTGVSAYLEWAILSGASQHRLTGSVGIGVLWAVVAPFCLWLWWTGRYDAVVFPSAHPEFASFSIRRDAERELEVMEFADAERERIQPRAEEGRG